jgi:glycosyltransferase involved in cell wall biosynthesis
MSKKKILHVTYDMRIGGTEMVIKNIIEGCDQEKYDMSIFCIEEPIGPWGKELIDNGTPIHTESRKEGFDFSITRAIRKVLKEERIDVIHCHQYTPWVYAVIAAIGMHKKVIFTEHGRFYPDSRSWKRRIVNPMLLLFTHSVSAISKATKQALVDYEFFPAHKVEVIYNGIKALQLIDEQDVIALKQELSIRPDDIVLGTVARLDPIKNHAMMLNAFSIITREYTNTKLVIVGDGELNAELKAQCKKLSISDRVIFTGYITKPSRYIQLFDIFLLSSLSEGTSMTLLEAMSLAKPCVVTDAGGNSEIVLSHINGVVTENGVSEFFANGIRDVILTDDKTLYMGIASQERFLQLFSADIMNKKYSELYQ